MNPPASGDHRKMGRHEGPVLLRNRRTPEFSAESRTFQPLKFANPTSALDRDRMVLEARKGSVGYEKRAAPPGRRVRFRAENPAPSPRPPTVTAPAPAPAPAPAEEKGSSSVWVLAMISAVAVAVVVAAVWAWRKRAAGAVKAEEPVAQPPAVRKPAVMASGVFRRPDSVGL